MFLRILLSSLIYRAQRLPYGLCTLVCCLSLAAQTLSPLQETLKAARSAARSGDVADAQTQLQTAFGMAIASDPGLAAGIAVEKADLLDGNKQTAEAIQSLIESADALQSNGSPAQVRIPVANRLANLARSMNFSGQRAEAKQALDKSLQILRDNYGPDALCVANVLSALEVTNYKLGDPETAMQQSAEAQRIRQANQTDAAQVRSINSGITAPQVKSKVDPQYSDQARAAHLSGTVLLSVVVSPDGQAKNIQVQMPLGFGLDEEAINAVEQWRFQPATAKADGQAVSVRASIEVNFRLL